MGLDGNPARAPDSLEIQLAASRRAASGEPLIDSPFATCGGGMHVVGKLMPMAFESAATAQPAS